MNFTIYIDIIIFCTERIEDLEIAGKRTDGMNALL